MDLLLHPALNGRVSVSSFGFGQTHIFFGPLGLGKQTSATNLARQANCQGTVSDTCSSCIAFSHGTSPDYILLEAEGASLGIDSVRNLHQMLSLTPARDDSKRVVIIDQAELLTTEAQNALLKLIEEPPIATTLILITTDLEALLPTVRSRAQSMYFPPLSEKTVKNWLTKLRLPADGNITYLASGSPGVAKRLAEEPQLLTQYEALDKVASQLLSIELFDRLLAIKDLEATPLNLDVLKHRLAARSLELALTGETSALVAVERLWRNLRASVTGRAALEALAAEI